MEDFKILCTKRTFCGKADVLNDPFMEVHLVQLHEAYVLGG